MALRWGILSTARHHRHVAGLGHRAGVRRRRLARRRARPRPSRASTGIARAHGSYEELLADPEVDAIYNPLPNALHVEWSIRALQAGKHVLCEKPLSRRPEEVERAFDVAEREGRVLAEAFMWRHHPQVGARPRARSTAARSGDLRARSAPLRVRRRPEPTSACRPRSTAAA